MDELYDIEEDAKKALKLRTGKKTTHTDTYLYIFIDNNIAYSNTFMCTLSPDEMSTILSNMNVPPKTENFYDILKENIIKNDGEIVTSAYITEDHICVMYTNGKKM